MTEVNDRGELVSRPRTTQWSGYPLPPLLPGRFVPQFNSVRQYTLPHPHTGRETAFSRATTIAAVLDDTYNLDLWIQRKLVSAVLEGVRLQMTLAGPDPQAVAELTDRHHEIHRLMNEIWTTDRTTQKYNRVIDILDNLSGGSDAREFGEAVHAWLAAIDVGAVSVHQVPEMFRAHVGAYRELCCRHALVPLADYVERIIFNDDTGLRVQAADSVEVTLSGGECVVGTLDRLFWTPADGGLSLGDIKTSKAESLTWGVLEFCVQLAVYRFAQLMLSLDGRSWGPMPALASDTAYLMHIPSDDYKRSACLALNTTFGSEAMRIAVYVRDLRRRAKREGLVGTIPIPSREALRYVEARHAIQNVSEPGQLGALWEQYQDVWNDDLTALGRQIADLFTQGGVLL